MHFASLLFATAFAVAVSAAPSKRCTPAKDEVGQGAHRISVWQAELGKFDLAANGMVNTPGELVFPDEPPFPCPMGYTKIGKRCSPEPVPEPEPPFPCPMGYNKLGKRCTPEPLPEPVEPEPFPGCPYNKLSKRCTPAPVPEPTAAPAPTAAPGPVAAPPTRRTSLTETQLPAHAPGPVTPPPQEDEPAPVPEPVQEPGSFSFTTLRTDGEYLIIQLALADGSPCRLVGDNMQLTCGADIDLTAPDAVFRAWPVKDFLGITGYELLGVEQDSITSSWQSWTMDAVNGDLQQPLALSNILTVGTQVYIEASN